jgi:hypothetical protein
MVTLLSNATIEILRLPLFISRAFALCSAFDTPVAFSFLATTGGKHARGLGSC